MIAAIQPGLIVELGTHWGESYFTFCQAVEEQQLPCLCYAVDHWQGDEHAGLYGEEVFDEVNNYNSRYYRQFSYLLRRSFDDALAQFEDGSIDLLHIDGLHTYDAVAHDFRCWLPKVRQGGIILLHDISPRHEDFGVWRLWDEIKAEFPDTFEFHHSWGLGVVARGHANRNSALAELLFDGSPSARENLRRHYVIYASHLENILGRFPLAAGRPAPVQAVRDIRVELFPYGEHGYSGDNCQIRLIRPGMWETLTFDLRVPVDLGPIRVDPGSEPSFIEIGDVLIQSGQSDDLVWESRRTSTERSFSAAGTSKFPFSDTQSFLISLGDDPQLMVVIPPGIGSPAKVSISLRIVPASVQAINLFDLFVSRLKDGINQLERQLKQQLEQQAEQHEQQVAALQRNNEGLVSELATVRNRASELSARFQANQLNLQEAQQKLLVAEDTLHRMHHSLSWKVTEPLRKLMALLRSGRQRPQS